MKKIIAAAAIFSLFPALALAQGTPGLSKGDVPTAGQWNSYFAAKQDVLGFTPLNVAGGVMTGRLVTAAPGATVSGLNLTPGTTPGSPSNGDVWITPLGMYARVNGATVGPFTASGTPITGPIAINLNSAALPPSQSGAGIQVSQADATPNRIELDSWGASSFLSCVRADGTAASPTTLVANDEICSVNAWGYDGATRSGPAGAMRIYAGGTWSNASHPTFIDFATTSTSSTTLISRMHVEADGGVTLNGGTSGGAGTINSNVSANTSVSWNIVNTNAGTSAAAQFISTNANGTGAFGVGGANLSNVGLANRAYVYSGVGGITLFSSGTNPIDAYVNNIRVGGFTSAGAFTLVTPLAVASGGSNCGSASGTCLDNITGFSSTGVLQRTGAGSYAFLSTSGSGTTLALATSPSIATPTITGALTYGGVALSASVTGTGPMVLGAAPTITGAATFSGVPVMSGLSIGTCSTGIALDASNNVVKVSCPSAASSIQLATTSITGVGSASGSLLYNNSGLVGNETLASILTATAGGGITATGTTSVALAVDTTYGAPKLLNTLTASNSASVQDTTSLTASFKEYDLVFENLLAATSGANCQIQIYTSGPTLQSTSYTATYFVNNSGGSAGGGTTTYIPCGQSQGAGSGISGRFTVYNPAQSSVVKVWTGIAAYGNNAGVANAGFFGGYWAGGNNAVVGFQITESTGNIASGTVKIYGRN